LVASPHIPLILRVKGAVSGFSKRIGLISGLFDELEYWHLFFTET
jgi:hypothetical protein